MSLKAIIISIFAGLASALCVMASFNVSSGAFPIMLLAAFPIYVATLSQGTSVGVGSSILAIMVAATAINPQVAVGLGLAFTIPASIIAHQANLAQHSDASDNSVEWYPLQNLFFNLCILLSVGLVILGFISGYNPERLAPILADAIQEALKATPPPKELSEQERQALINNVFKILPFFFAGVWLIIHIINLYLATIVCRASKMMPRPKDDIPAQANLPKMAILIAFAALALSFITSGILQFAALIVAGIFVKAFALLGLANSHLRSRENGFGIVVLFASYAAVFFLYPVIYLFSLSGALRIFSQSNQSTNSPPNAE